MAQSPTENNVTFFNKIHMLQLYDTAENWKTKNPFLLEGEIAIESDTGLIKIGLGNDHTYNDSPYATNVKIVSEKPIYDWGVKYPSNCHLTDLGVFYLDTTHNKLYIATGVYQTGTSQGTNSVGEQLRQTYTEYKEILIEVIDNLTSTDTNKALSANQGKVLKDLVDTKADKTDLTKYVKNTDYATASKAGIVKIGSSNYGLGINTYKELFIVQATNAQIKARDNDCVPIVPKNLNTAVKAALSDDNCISDMTDTEKSNARNVIGAASETSVQELSESKNKVYVKQDDPKTIETGTTVSSYQIGDIWLNEKTSTLFILEDVVSKELGEGTVSYTWKSYDFNTYNKTEIDTLLGKKATIAGEKRTPTSTDDFYIDGTSGELYTAYFTGLENTPYDWKKIDVNVLDNLTTDSKTDALSAGQGKVLKSLVDSKADKATTLEGYGITDDYVKFEKLDFDPKLNPDVSLPSTKEGTILEYDQRYYINKKVTIRGQERDFLYLITTWVRNDLNGTDSDDALSAAQGPVIKGLIDNKSKVWFGDDNLTDSTDGKDVKVGDLWVIEQERAYISVCTSISSTKRTWESLTTQVTSTFDDDSIVNALSASAGKELKELVDNKLDKSSAIGKNGTGDNSEIFNDYSSNVSSGGYSHAEGYMTQSTNTATHAEGCGTHAMGLCTHAEGYETYALYSASHTEGFQTTAGKRMHTIKAIDVSKKTITLETEGNLSVGDVFSVYSENLNLADCGTILAIDTENHIITVNQINSSITINEKLFVPYKPKSGDVASLLGFSSHAEGTSTNAYAEASHAEGWNTSAYGLNSHAEGDGTFSLGDASHAEGANTYAYGENSHTEGDHAQTGRSAYEIISVNNTDKTITLKTVKDLSIDDNLNLYVPFLPIQHNGLIFKNFGKITAIDNIQNIITVDNFNENIKKGTYLYVEKDSDYFRSIHGDGSYILGKQSHAEGYQTIAMGNCQHVEGKGNVVDTDNKYVHIVGNGTYDNNKLKRANAHTLDWNGNSWYAGNIKFGGTSYDDAKEVEQKQDIIVVSRDNTTVSTEYELVCNTYQRYIIEKELTKVTLTMPETINLDYNFEMSIQIGDTAPTWVCSYSPIKWHGVDCDKDGVFVPQSNTIYEISMRYIGTNSEGNKMISARVGTF